MVASCDVIDFAEIVKTIYIKKYSQKEFARIVDLVYFEIFVKQSKKRKRERRKRWKSIGQQSQLNLVETI